MAWIASRREPATCHMHATRPAGSHVIVSVTPLASRRPFLTLGASRISPRCGPRRADCADLRDAASRWSPSAPDMASYSARQPPRRARARSTGAPRRRSAWSAPRISKPADACSSPRSAGSGPATAERPGHDRSPSANFVPLPGGVDYLHDDVGQQLGMDGELDVVGRCDELPSDLVERVPSVRELEPMAASCVLVAGRSPASSARATPRVATPPERRRRQQQQLQRRSWRSCDFAARERTAERQHDS
jgi:hypothetical protein